MLPTLGSTVQPTTAKSLPLNHTMLGLVVVFYVLNPHYAGILGMKLLGVYTRIKLTECMQGWNRMSIDEDETIVARTRRNIEGKSWGTLRLHGSLIRGPSGR